MTNQILTSSNSSNSYSQNDAVTVCEKVSNKAGTGQTEWKTFKFTPNNTFDYTVKILFDMYSAKDKMTVYQVVQSNRFRTSYCKYTKQQGTIDQ